MYNLSSYYLTNRIKILEPIINNILQKIKFKIDFFVDIVGQFNFNLIKNNIKYTYKDLSTGEELLLQIAFKLALLMEQGLTGVLIADEGMSSLDSTNFDHILTIIRTLPFYLNFVIHNANNIPSDIKVIELIKT